MFVCLLIESKEREEERAKEDGNTGRAQTRKERKEMIHIRNALTICQSERKSCDEKDVIAVTV